MTTLDYDYLVIGSGLAGLMAALNLSRHGRVMVASKKEAVESNSNYAQGGIACAIDPEDSFDEHVQDTMKVGAYLSNEEVARAIISSGPARIQDLEALGVAFERRESHGEDYDLGQEGGHSRRRVLHAGDITGQRMIRVLLDRVAENANITLRDHLMAIDLVTTGWLKQPGESRCIGGYFLDQKKGEILAIRSSFTVLATGGAGKVYLYTSNPDVATGDGIAMAWRAGLPIKNMEFVQFHPTCLYHPAAKSFLISEAVRGEGAVLINTAGESFMERYDSRGSLAPRDVVARAIDNEMKTRGDTCVYLDISHRSARFLKKRFPNIYAACLKYGFNMAKQPIPVVPAAHYFCGGVEAGVDGRTALKGLFACGEAACTGLHGANRLASNSLLEALVCSHRAAETIAQMPREHPTVEIPAWRYNDAVPSDEAVVVEHNWNELRTCMWDYVGIVRTNKRLERALRRINNLRQEIRQYYLAYLVTADVLELRNIAAVAALVVRSAMLRRESRGLHYTLDYPQELPGTPTDTRICDQPGG
ncbi:MAG TPA: L-aspartate oxidase [Verrucomicrobia bacterium]|nr:MAG: L-aspartate oxidase [Lentisphaerae bacterium GWF2_57_35]HBA84578.1 L-aspartate oxidase [Verrucomicrobiota bacterium]